MNMNELAHQSLNALLNKAERDGNEMSFFEINVKFNEQVTHEGRTCEKVKLYCSELISDADGSEAGVEESWLREEILEAAHGQNDRVLISGKNTEILFE